MRTPRGLLDLAVLTHFPASAVPKVIREIDDVNSASNHYVRYRQLRKFTLESEAPVHFNVDGEPVNTTSMDFGIARQCLDVALRDRLRDLR